MLFYTLSINPCYEISRCGIVRNKTTKRPIKQVKYKCGYIYVGLKSNKKTSTQKLHRLLAIMFIPNPDNHLTVDHINREKDDNRLENLRWANFKTQNNNRTSRNNKNYGNSVEKYSLTGVFIEKFDKIKQACESLNITYTLFNKLNKKHSGQFYINNFKIVIHTIKEHENEEFRKVIIDNVDTGYKISNYGTLLNKKNKKTNGSPNLHGYLVCTINRKGLFT